VRSSGTRCAIKARSSRFLGGNICLSLPTGAMISKETILASGKERLENSPAQEKAAGLVEIIKIANLRLQDIIETLIAAVAAA
jgi:OHCU decarboxylase